MAAAAGTGVRACYLDVYGGWQIAALALAGLVIAVTGALHPAGGAAGTRTASAPCAPLIALSRHFEYVLPCQEVLAEQRLGHRVPGMRGLYAHASDRMRDELKAALQARWEESLSARAAIDPRSPVPLLDELLAPHLGTTRKPAEQTTPRPTQRQPPTPGDREKMISQIPPKRTGSRHHGD